MNSRPTDPTSRGTAPRALSRPAGRPRRWPIPAPRGRRHPLGASRAAATRATSAGRAAPSPSRGGPATKRSGRPATRARGRVAPPGRGPIRGAARGIDGGRRARAGGPRWRDRPRGIQDGSAPPPDAASSPSAAGRGRPRRPATSSTGREWLGCAAPGERPRGTAGSRAGKSLARSPAGRRGPRAPRRRRGGGAAVGGIEGRSHRARGPHGRGRPPDRPGCGGRAMAAPREAAAAPLRWRGAVDVAEAPRRDATRVRTPLVAPGIVNQ